MSTPHPNSTEYRTRLNVCRLARQLKGLADQAASALEDLERRGLAEAIRLLESVRSYRELPPTLPVGLLLDVDRFDGYRERVAGMLTLSLRLFDGKTANFRTTVLGFDEQEAVRRAFALVEGVVALMAVSNDDARDRLTRLLDPSN